MSSPQTVPTVLVYDYLIGQDGSPLVNVDVRCVLQYPTGTNNSPLVSLAPAGMLTRTDANGYYQFAVVANADINPEGTTYLIWCLAGSWQVQIPSGAGPFQTPSIVVSGPVSLQPGGGTVGALTVTGLLTAEGGLDVTATPVSFPTGSIAEAAVAGLPAALANTMNLTGNQVAQGSKQFQGTGSASAWSVEINNPVAAAAALVLQAITGTVTTQQLLQIVNPSSVVVHSVDNAGNTITNGTLFAGGLITANNGVSVTGNATASGNVTTGAHLLANNTTAPTLGALQTGVASQSLSAHANDVSGQVTVNTSASPPAGGGAMCIVNFSTAYTNTPIVMVTRQNGGLNSCFVATSVSTTGFTITNSTGAALGASTGYGLGYFVIGTQ